ncbi:MAG TPA: transketolase C-terminal domain-containing protein [Steroidobacteraceae bacterium]|nr:transketolase C-terminal domain-containing protein [Steroidobacteraceae bacterium]
MSRRSFLEAIRDAQFEEMRRDPSVFMMGEDIASNLFGTTTGFVAAFGADRVRNTPISEAGFIGAAAGASMVGMRPIVDVTIASFIYPAMDQLISIISKSRYLYGGQARLPLVLRLSMFYGNSTAAQHSDRPYPMLMAVPGLKIIIPSNARDMKGLLKAAVRDDDPVLSFEDAALWSTKMDVPDEESFLVPLGKAEVKREGTDATVVALAAAVPQALAAATELAKEGISVEVVDPRTLVPLDAEAILTSVRKTGRLVAVDPAHRTCSAASEIAALAAERAFGALRAPIVRVTAPDTHVPFSPPLEARLFPNTERIAAAVRRVMSGA